MRNREGRGQEGSVLNIRMTCPTSFHYYHEAWLFPALSSSSPTPELAPAEFYDRYAWPCDTRKRNRKTNQRSHVNICFATKPQFYLSDERRRAFS